MDMYLPSVFVFVLFCGSTLLESNECVIFPHPDAYTTFQIDVENPCVIMSQDKSREFLHSGNDKDKFKVINSFSFLPIPLYQ